MNTTGFKNENGDMKWEWDKDYCNIAKKRHIQLLLNVTSCIDQPVVFFKFHKQIEVIYSIFMSLRDMYIQYIFIYIS